MGKEVFDSAAEHGYRFLIHDRDTIFARGVDDTLRAFGIQPLKTPVRSPKANTYCEHLIGTLRRDCPDYFIPLSENHLRLVLKDDVKHDNLKPRAWDSRLG